MMNRYFVLFFLCVFGLQSASCQRLYAQRLLRQYEVQLDLEAQPYSDLLEDLEAGENTDGFSLEREGSIS